MTHATCHEVGDELVAYLDGELSESERRPIANHVATCLVCRREIEHLTAVGRLVRDLPRVEPSAGFADRFWDRLDAEPRDRLPQMSLARSLRSMRWALPGLAVAALLALAFSSLVRVATQPTGSARRVVAAPAPAAQPKIAAAPPSAATEEAPQLANVDDLKPEDLPPALLEHPELFLRLPVVRRLDKLEHFEAVQQEPASEDGAG